MSRKTSDVFRAGDITVDGTLNSNESQLIFRAKQKPYNPYSGRYYSLSAAQIDDPTIRINQYAADGTFEAFGYLYDTQFNPVPAGTRISVAGGIGDPAQEPNPSIIYSYDNIHWYPWTNQTNLFAGGGCTALAYNSFIFVAGGSATATNRMLYSANGTQWIASSSGTTLCAGGCTAIATNGGLWIAGTSGAYRVISSLDGINWYPSAIEGADSILTQSCNAVAWSGTLWLAGGNGNDLSGSDIIRSTDGTFWLPSNNSNTIFEKCLALAWNGTFWLAGGIPLIPGNPTIAISYDGITWTAVPVTSPTIGTPVYSLSISCNAIAWSGAQWVIGGQDVSGNSLAYSYDGTAWFPGTNSTFIVCNAVSWDGNSWAAAGLGTNSLVTSFDGVNWTPSIEGNLLFVEGGAVCTNKILPNAASLQQINVTTSSAALTLIGASGETVIAFSKDGITWTPSTSASREFPESACLGLSWNGYIWVGGFGNTSNGRTMGNSADGITWGSNASGSSLFTISCNAIANSESLWIAGGAGSTRLAYSYDAISWASITDSSGVFDPSASDLVHSGVCNTVAWNGTLWVAGSDCSNNRLAYSYDGSANWVGSSSGNAIFTKSCNGVAWNGLLWIAVGDASGSVAAYSYNGIDWTRITDTLVTTGERWLGIACNDSTWILSGTGAHPILFSYDGINWNAATGALPSSVTAVTWNGVVWVATGAAIPDAIYSYNGNTWINSYNGNGVFPTGATTVATNRPQATAGNTRPTPTLYASTKDYVGAVTYTPLDATLNSLYPSTTLIVDDANHRAGVNRVPASHADVGGVSRAPTLDLSGTGIYVQTGGAQASLSLMNGGAQENLVARIEMLDLSANAGWSIDDTSGSNHLQLTSWKNRNPFTVVDISPGDSGAGKVDINGLDPLAPNGAALYVNGMDNQNQLALSVHGHTSVEDISATTLSVSGVTHLQETHVTTLYVPTVNPDGSTVSIGGANGLTIEPNTNGGVTVQANGNLIALGGNSGGSRLAIWNGNSFYPDTTNTGLIGATDKIWDSAYVNSINPNGIRTAIGGTAHGLLVDPSGTADGTVLIGNPQLILGTVGSIQTVAFNGGNLTGLPGNTLDLGTTGGYNWRNLYVNGINPNGVRTTIGGSSYGLIVDASGAADGTVLIGKPQLILGASGSAFTVAFNGANLTPFPTNTIDLGTTGGYNWRNLYVNGINPTTITPAAITVIDSGFPGSGSYTLPYGNTYTITVIAVGGGGGGGGWYDYGSYPANAGGGSGAYITYTTSGIAGGSIINFTIGALGVTGSSAGGGAWTTPPATPGGNSSVSIAGATYIAGGGIAAAVVSSGNPFAGGGGMQSVGGSSLNGNAGTVGSYNTTNGYGGVSVYLGYGGGGNVASPAVPGYVRIIATPTPISITNDLGGITRINSLYNPTVASPITIQYGNITLLPTGTAYTSEVAISLTTLNINGLWLVFSYISPGGFTYGDANGSFATIIYMNNGLLVGGGCTQFNDHAYIHPKVSDQQNLYIEFIDITTSIYYGVYAKCLFQL